LKKRNRNDIRFGPKYCLKTAIFHQPSAHLTLTIAAMPAHNEERAIAKVVPDCKKYVDKVVVVDDGSTDHTSEVAELADAAKEGLRVKKVEIGVRYDVDCLTEHPVSHRVLVKVLYEMELKSAAVLLYCTGHGDGFGGDRAGE
jgi:hypothetical protein